MEHLELDIHFAPCDRLNPGFGYGLWIRDAATGAVLLSTSVDQNGKDLKSPKDCIRRVKRFIRNATPVRAAA